MNVTQHVHYTVEFKIFYRIRSWHTEFLKDATMCSQILVKILFSCKTVQSFDGLLQFEV